MYLSLSRKWDYSSWDKEGNTTLCSRYFKFKNVEIRIDRQMVTLSLYESKDSEVCNKEFKISNGKFLFDNVEDRLIINIIKNENAQYLDNYGIYVSITYYKNYNTNWNYNFENKKEFFIMSKYAYNKERWVGITRNDINEFYNTIRKCIYIEIPTFKDNFMEYNNES